MNICYISDVDISVDNGPGINEREFLRVMLSEAEVRGDNVSFIIPKPSHSIDMSLKNAFYLPPESKKSILQTLRMLPFAFCLLYYLIKIDTVDFFLIRIGPAMLSTILLFPLLRKKYCIKTLSNTYEFGPTKLSKINQAYLFLIRKMLRRVLQRSLFTDTCTPQLRTNYSKKYSIKNIAVIDNSVNTDAFVLMDKLECKKRLGLEKFSTIIGYCGGYPSQRGAKQLVELSPILISKYPELGILIVGDDAELESIERLAKDLQTSEHVVFTGAVDYAELPFYINCLDVGIGLDTHDKIQYVGNSSQKLRQYIACGVPIVCPENTNAKIVDKGIGKTTCPENLDSVLEALCFFIDSPQTNNAAFREECHRYAKENLSVRLTYKQRYAEWEKVIQKGRVAFKPQHTNT